MKIARYFLPLLVLVFAQCFFRKKNGGVVEPPPPKPGAVSKGPYDLFELTTITIDTLEGVFSDEEGAMDVVVDSLVIDLAEVAKELKTETKRPKQKLTISSLRKGRIVLQKSDLPLEMGAPSLLDSFIIRRVVLVNKGRPVQVFTDVVVPGPKIESHSKGQSRLGGKPIMVVVQSLLDRIRELEKRFEELRRQAESKKVVQPAHAARMLPPEIQEFLGRLREMRDYYISVQFPPIKVVRVDQEELDAMELTVGDMEEEIDSPTADPIALRARVLFGTGLYLLDNTRQQKELQNVVAQLEAGIRKRLNGQPRSPVTILMAIDGHADEQRIEQDGPLADDLQSRYGRRFPPPDGTNDAHWQPYLNQLLSQARADEVQAYLTDAVQRVFPGQNIRIETDPVGKGWATPQGFIRNCPDDCQERRVVLVSSIKFRDTPAADFR